MTAAALICPPGGPSGVTFPPQIMRKELIYEKHKR